MRLSRTARTLLSVTALAWSIPFAQAASARGDAEEDVRPVELRGSVAGDATQHPGSGNGRAPRE